MVSSTTTRSTSHRKILAYRGVLAHDRILGSCRISCARPIAPEKGAPGAHSPIPLHHHRSLEHGLPHERHLSNHPSLSLLSSIERRECIYRDHRVSSSICESLHETHRSSPAACHHGFGNMLLSIAFYPWTHRTSHIAHRIARCLVPLTVSETIGSEKNRPTSVLYYHPCDSDTVHPLIADR